MDNLFQLWPQSLLFERKNLDDISEEDMMGVVKKAYMPGFLDYRITNVTAILCLLYDARKVDPNQYLNKVYLPWIYLKSKTSKYQMRILKEIARQQEFEENSEEDILHAVNLYRSIISELFDPLLTLLYASYRFIDGNVSDLFNVDLHAGERQKFEYVNARLKCDTLFLGYNPEVRNATSHAGGNGVSINNGLIEFRSVKRGDPPKIKLVKWSYDDLFMRIIELMEFVHSIDLCSDIFGIDSLDIISSEFSSLSQMIYYAMSDDQEAEILKNTELKLSKIRKSTEISHSKKLEILSTILIGECNKRGVSPPICSYSKDNNMLVTKVNRGRDISTEDEFTIEAATYLTRYSILARSIFGDLIANYEVQEEYSDNNTLKARFVGDLIDKYIAKDAGLVDLLNDGDFFENGKYLGIKVDYNALETAEKQFVGKPFPRMER